LGNGRTNARIRFAPVKEQKSTSWGLTRTTLPLQ
jgi:hypothetical protein